MAKRVLDFQITENKKLKKDFYILELRSPSPLPQILPGQFVQVRIDGSSDTFLRRPISVYDVDYLNNSIRILIQVVGNGTETLSHVVPGNSLNLVFPLGNSFTVPEKGEKVLLAGGGVGIAPMLLFARIIKEMNSDNDTYILLGFRNSERVIDYEEFRLYGKVFISTEDGSEGEKGFITDHSILKNTRFDRIYCCGPDPMMKAVASYANLNEIFCEVSLEHLMACGFGVCLCCVVGTTKGNLCTCTDGPVFNTKELKW